MAVLTSQSIPTEDNFAPTFTDAASGGDEASSGAGYFAVVKNSGSSAHTVTARVPVTVGGACEVTANVPAGGETWLMLPGRNQARYTGKDIYKHGTDNATLAYDAVAESGTQVLTVASVRAA